LFFAHGDHFRLFAVRASQDAVFFSQMLTTLIDDPVDGIYLSLIVLI